MAKWKKQILKNVIYKIQILFKILVCMHVHYIHVHRKRSEKMLKWLPLTYKIMGNFNLYAFSHLIIIVYLPSIFYISPLWMCLIFVIREEL